MYTLYQDDGSFDILTDPAFPGQFRVVGTRIEKVVATTSWDYYEAVQRFQRIMDAQGSIVLYCIVLYCIIFVLHFNRFVFVCICFKLHVYVFKCAFFVYNHILNFNNKKESTRS